MLKSKRLAGLILLAAVVLAGMAFAQTDTFNAASRLERKLQAFYKELDRNEKVLMRRILLAGADGERTALGQSSTAVTFTVGGRVMKVTPTAGGSTTNPDKGKDGATQAGQRGGTQSSDGTKTVGIRISF